MCVYIREIDIAHFKHLIKALLTMKLSMIDCLQDVSYFDNHDNSVGAMTRRLATDASAIQEVSRLTHLVAHQLLSGLSLRFQWTLGARVPTRKGTPRHNIHMPNIRHRKNSDYFLRVFVE